jgi:circadian clock protein KaiC
MTTTKACRAPIVNAATGIAGLDSICTGGIPPGCVTLIEGGPGAGKTVLALQTLVHGAKESHEPGIFVAFEEGSARIIANAACFGWDLIGLQKKKLFFLNAQPSADVIQSGGIDLGKLCTGHWPCGAWAIDRA